MHDLSIPRMATIGETAAMFGLSQYFVRRLVRSGQVVAVQTGCKYLVNIDRFAEFLNGNRIASENDANETSSGGIKPITLDLKEA